MSAKSIDLHMHSFYSEDGEFTPSELVEQCSARGIQFMSITDHNCVRANGEGKRAAQAAGITYIPGVELDCVYQGIQLHVLGYGIDYESPDFRRIEQNIEEQSAAASRKMLLATQEMGFFVTENEMQKLAEKNYWKDRWIPEMFAEVLLAKQEYQGHPALQPYRPGGERSDNPFVNFYWDFYAQGKAGYVPMEYPPLEQIAEVIHRNGGTAVLAHPGMNLRGKEEVLESLIGTGIDGIEAFSSYHTAEQCRYFYGEARKRGVFVTCGSDYHGKTKPSIYHGKHGCLLSEPEMYEELKNI